jgi:O-antigen/teichoic acid export membrane protein
VSQGLWAVTDQGLFALTNFTVSALLARWLSPTDYGAFAVAFSVLLLMGTVHTALLTEPMLILGPSRFRERTAAYVRRLSTLHFALTSVMGVALLLIVAGLAVLQSPFRAATTLAALAVSAPAILFLWLLRRACYIESRPRLAAASALVYALLVPAGMFSLTQVGVLTAASGVMTMAMSGLVVAIWLMLRLTRYGAEQTTTISRPEVTRAHWTYGRWALGSGLLSWVPSNAVVLALPLWHSLEDAGALRVATTLMLPVLHVQGALGPLFMPTLVRARLSGRLRSSAFAMGSLFLALSAFYAPVILIFGSWFAELLFGTQYPIDGRTLWLLAAIPLVSAVSGVAGAVLRVVERPDRVLWTYVAATTVTLLVGLPLVSAYGVDGALASLLLSAATTAILGIYEGRRFVAAPRQPTGAWTEPDTSPDVSSSGVTRAWNRPTS